jgi:serine-type D-Ala-D-Ala carboxypeptidase/endopeptidase
MRCTALLLFALCACSRSDTFAPAIAPVRVADMQATLARDLGPSLASGALAEGTGVGVAIGIVRDGERRVFAFGSAKQDSIFEIGSISKTFTGLVLAQLIEQGRVTADQPVRELLPEGTVEKPAGDEISLLDLVTQHSGLPRMPDNFEPADWDNPYVDYDAARLYAFVASHGVERPAATEYQYSNVGFGLLGHALALHAGTDYPALVRTLVTDPLCMSETTVALGAELRARLLQGYDHGGDPAHVWDLDALAGAGALRSSAGDMLRYLEAQLQPDQTCAAGASDAARTLPAALRRAQELQADAEDGRRIAFAWIRGPKSGTYGHSGGTGGYGSYAFFNLEKRYAGVVLTNQGPPKLYGQFLASALARHIEQRLNGEPAVEIE